MRKRERFERLFNENFGTLIFYAKKLTNGNSDDAKDLVQDTMLRTYKNLDKYSSDKGKFSTWASSIMKNIFIDKIRKEKDKNFFEYEELFSDDGSVLNIIYGNEHKRVFDKMYFDDVMSMLNQIPEKNRIPLLMYMEGYSTKEIAKKLDAPEGTIRPRIYYGRKKLKKIIENNQ